MDDLIMQYTFSDKISPLKPSAIREIFKSLADPSIISFAAGNPAPESFPVRELSRISAEIFENRSAEALQYSITEGYTPLRELVSARLKEKFGIGGEDDMLIITSGGQQGLDLTAKVLCNEGDTVIVENPSFIGALNAFRAYNTVLKSVDLNEDGMDLVQLEQLLASDKRVRMIYTIPTFQNPKGTTASAENRRAVLALAKKYGVIVLEDNPYGELRFAGEEVPTIKSMDTEGHVVYSGSFSKVLSAGMRVGFLCGPKEILTKVVVAKQVNDVHTNIFFQMMAAEYMDKCDMDAHIARIRKLYRTKCGAMLAAMDQYFDKRVQYTRPQGGLFLWVTLPGQIDMPTFVQRAIERKVAVVPGSAFLTDESLPCSSFRMNYSMPSLEQIDTGCRILGELADEMLGD